MKAKICLVSLILSVVCVLAYAEHADETPMPLSNDVNVIAPTQQQGAWSFGITGGLMQSTNNSNINNANVSNNNTLAGGDITYALPNSSNDASLSYERGF